MSVSTTTNIYSTLSILALVLILLTVNPNTINTAVSAQTIALTGSISSITDTTAQLTIRSNVTSKIYLSINYTTTGNTDTAAAVTTVSQLIDLANSNYNNTTPYRYNSIIPSIIANTDNKLLITGLSSLTNYTIYIIANDSTNSVALINTYSNLLVLSFKTNYTTIRSYLLYNPTINSFNLNISVSAVTIINLIALSTSINAPILDYNSPLLSSLTNNNNNNLYYDSNLTIIVSTSNTIYSGILTQLLSNNQYNLYYQFQTINNLNSNITNYSPLFLLTSELTPSAALISPSITIQSINTNTIVLNASVNTANIQFLYIAVKSDSNSNSNSIRYSDPLIFIQQYKLYNNTNTRYSVPSILYSGIVTGFTQSNRYYQLPLSTIFQPSLAIDLYILIVQSSININQGYGPIVWSLPSLIFDSDCIPFSLPISDTSTTFCKEINYRIYSTLNQTALDLQALTAYNIDLNWWRISGSTYPCESQYQSVNGESRLCNNCLYIRHKYQCAKAFPRCNSPTIPGQQTVRMCRSVCKEKNSRCKETEDCNIYPTVGCSSAYELYTISVFTIVIITISNIIIQLY